MQVLGKLQQRIGQPPQSNQHNGRVSRRAALPVCWIRWDSHASDTLRQG